MVQWPGANSPEPARRRGQPHLPPRDRVRYRALCADLTPSPGSRCGCRPGVRRVARMVQENSLQAAGPPRGAYSAAQPEWGGGRDRSNISYRRAISRAGVVQSGAVVKLKRTGTTSGGSGLISELNNSQTGNPPEMAGIHRYYRISKRERGRPDQQIAKRNHDSTTKASRRARRSAVSARWIP